MQVPEEESNSCKRVGVEEHLIKFRSSPNFKNMKKFIKSRSANHTGKDDSPLSHGLGHESPSLAALGTPEPLSSPNITTSAIVTADIEPPLPLEPPPPDNPSNFEVKTEGEDFEYGNDNQIALEEDTFEAEDGYSEQMTEPKREMCRDYIRGNCKRQGTCRFAHKFDLSQLEGVYTFCRKYQNSICPYTICRYVHASVFEERHFYRTGVLPPHALAHHQVNVLQQPPPPPPEEHPAPVALSPNVAFSNPPPPLQSVIHQAPAVASTSSAPGGGRACAEDAWALGPLPRAAPANHSWRATDTFSVPAAACDRAFVEHMPRKCKNCEDTNIRLQYNLEKVHKMKQSKEVLNKKMAALEKKSNKLLSIILAMLKPTISSMAQNRANGVNGDSDTLLMDQFNIGR